ncbi:MAG: hypothetical protein WAK57_05865, partial [Desulfobacterales bacterium]
MGVRKYKANSIAEAVRKVKSDLGADAMILSTRQVPKGFKNPYGADMFEVCALSAGEAPPAGEGDRAFAEALSPGAPGARPG